MKNHWQTFTTSSYMGDRSKMHRFLVVVLGVFILCNEVISAESGNEIPEFLEKFGYLQKKTSSGGQHSAKDMESALRSYQRFMHLKPTGMLDKATFELMKKPRCGFPDIVRADNPFAPDQPIYRKRKGKRKRTRARAKKPVDYVIAESFTAPRYKWTGKKVTWKVLGYTNQLPPGPQRRAFTSAFKKWAEVIPLKIRETAGRADIEITFNRRDHGDGARNAFDGRGGVLAHAYYPGSSPISGDTHFDDDEKWTLTSEGTNLEISAAHEFGHALGLSHSQDYKALMAPIYRYSTAYKLGSDDIRAIQSLYGSPQTSQTRVTTPTRSTITTAKPSNHCSIRFSAITEGHDGSVYAFYKRNIYKLKRYGGLEPGFPKFVRWVYKKAPINAHAVTYSQWTGKTYFFKGGKVWRFTGFERDPGYPKVLSDPNHVRSPNAALVWRDGRIYLFKGRNFYLWDPRTEKIVAGYPRLIKKYWRKVPGNADSAMLSRDGYTYFFKFNRYFKYDAYSRRVSRGYPKDKARPWLRCGEYSPR